MEIDWIVNDSLECENYIQNFYIEFAVEAAAVIAIVTLIFQWSSCGIYKYSCCDWSFYILCNIWLATISNFGRSPLQIDTGYDKIVEGKILAETCSAEIYWYNHVVMWSI